MLEKYIDITKINNSKLLRMLADYYCKANEYKKACLILCKLKNIKDVDLIDIYIYISKCLYKQRKFKEAAKLLEDRYTYQEKKIIPFLILTYYRLKNYKKVLELSDFLTLEEIISARSQDLCLESSLFIKNYANAKLLVDSNSCLPFLEADYYYMQKDYIKALELYKSVPEIPEQYVATIRNYLNCLFLLNKKLDLQYLYCHEYKNNNQDTLTITLHPFVKKFLFYKATFYSDVLFLSQKNFMSFFIIDPENFAKYVYSLFSKSYKKIVILGSSKGSTGVILLGFHLAKLTDTAIYSFAFSPQTNLYNPESQYMKELPSYVAFNKIANSYDFVKFYQKRNGNIQEYFSQQFFPKNYYLTILFGENHPLDNLQAYLLAHYAKLYPIKNYPFHGVVILLYTKQTLKEKYDILTDVFKSTPDDKLLYCGESISFEKFKKIHDRYHIKLQKLIPEIEWKLI